MLHPLQVLQDWLRGVVQNRIPHVVLRAGHGNMSYKLKSWFVTGDCHLESAVASDIIDLLRSKPQWCKPKIVLLPFYLPDSFQEDTPPNFSTQLFMSVAEHFRRAIVPQYIDEWNLTLPRLPCTTNELKEATSNRHQQDEQTILTHLAALGSVSAQIITKLQLTRGVVVEALQHLQNERRAQCNLLMILSAARYKMLTKDGLSDTVCPLTRCNERDTFEHMLQCYDLTTKVERGEAAVNFLIAMARKTQILDPKAPRPFPTLP